MKDIRTIPLLLFAGFATACVSITPVKSTVTAFHTLPETPQPATFAIVALDAQQGDLEFATYRQYLRDELIRYSWIEVAPENAQYLVAFAYAIDQGKVATVSMPVWGQTGVSSSSTTGTVSTYGSTGTYSGTTTYTPTYGVTGYVPVSRTEFTRVMRIVLMDHAAEDALMYQADVISVGSSAQIAPVMPAMISAVFKKFPGKSGQTRSEIGRLD